MVAFAITDFGGTIPRKDPRLLPNGMAEAAWNCDLASGPLDGLVEPQQVIDLSSAPDPVERAYRVPGPTVGVDADAWLPLPSRFSSAVRSPLANDTLHRIYWSNPPGVGADGAWWNTYARIAAGNTGGNAPYNLGFIAPDPAIVLTATASGGSLPALHMASASVASAGTGYTVGTALSIIGGTLSVGGGGAAVTVAAVDGSGGILAVTPLVVGDYLTPPSNPAAVGLLAGTGTGALLSLTYTATGIPEVARSYTFTYIDIYGEESSPAVPSAILDAASDGTWVLHGLPTSVPASPGGTHYPAPAKIRIYRTLTGTTTDFFQVAEVTFGSATYTDVIPDTTIVNNNTLGTTSFLPPPPQLDGLVGFPGGMLMGFTGNTIHFCEPERPNAWPAGYDQSLQYQIQGFGVWQNSLVVLTKGFPSTGAGTAPANFIFSQVQVPEPCISRGSIITDLMGVYYASQNGLVMLNYFGMQNQTLSNFTKQIWLDDFHAADIIACRHRAQYLAINGTGTGFIIDYTEPRLGVVKLNTFLGVTCVWNDVFTGDTYMLANKVVYLWDSADPAALSLRYRWRSKQFYLPAPTSLGACQISLATAVETPPGSDALPPLDNADASLDLPAGVNAIFRLYAGPEGKTLVITKVLDKARMIFRLPSGRKVFNWQCEIVGRVAVHSIELASTMKELGQV